MKTHFIGITILALLFSACAAGPVAVRERSAEIPREKNWIAKPVQETRGYASADSRILSPFIGLFSRARYFIIAFFDNHPVFESVEAFVYAPEKIRAILTRHDNTQIDFVNFDLPPESQFNRPTVRTQISFRMAKNNTDAELCLTMENNQELVLIYLGSAPPESTWGGMTDVGLHSSDGGLPLFFREESGVAAAGSYVRIGAVKYPIPVDETISVRPFFIAYSAFICTGYNGLIFPTFHEQVPLYTEAAGAQAGLFESEIITVRNGSVFETAKVVYSSWLYDDAAKAEIVFNPPLANLHALAVGSTAVSRFVIRFSASKQDEVYGDVIVKKEDQSRVVVDLVPFFPGWAKESRAMRYTVLLNDAGADVEARMKGADAK